jgi:hypothetical protein
MCLIMYKYILQIPKKDRINNQQIHFHCVNFILDWWKTSHGIRTLSLIQETYPFTLSNSCSFLSQYISFHCFYNFSSLFLFSQSTNSSLLLLASITLMATSYHLHGLKLATIIIITVLFIFFFSMLFSISGKILSPTL